jgi:hypothetical protein
MKCSWAAALSASAANASATRDLMTAPCIE